MDVFEEVIFEGLGLGISRDGVPELPVCDVHNRLARGLYEPDMPGLTPSAAC